MPELPEVETMRRGILEIEGEPIEAIRNPRCKKRPIQIQPGISTLNRQLKGKTVQQVDRWGKRLILVIGKKRLVFEPRMTGLITLSDPPTNEHLRVRVSFKSLGRDLLFWDQRGLGTVTLYSDDEFEQRFGNGVLGPDALSITEEQLRTNLNSRSLEIKVGLLDQKAVAGIGNIYASEILFLAGVHPQAKCSKLSRKQWRTIFDKTGLVLNNAIQYEGSSLGDGTYRTKLNEPGRYQHHHAVYDREGERCLFCNQRRIKRIVQAQRSTYFCTSCQRKK